MENWLPQQVDAMIGGWETAIDRFYPEHAQDWRDPDAHYRALTTQWNTLAAAERVDWPRLLPESGAAVLDLGAGTGWLSALLSKRAEVARIDAIDSGRHNIEVMMPAIVERMLGQPDKIRAVRALFSPLPVADETYDLVVASSALHHAPNLLEVLRECQRVLRPGGVLIALNEVPLNAASWVWRSGRIYASSVLAAVRGRYHEYSPSISKSGLLYDPYLGDRSYTLAQWRHSFRAAGFSFEVQCTGLDSYKSRKGDRLIHFIGRTAQTRSCFPPRRG